MSLTVGGHNTLLVSPTGSGKTVMAVGDTSRVLGPPAVRDMTPPTALS